MDAIDVRILDLLQDNARQTHADIAKDVGLSGPSVSERIRKLEEEGVILGYHARLNPEKVGKHISAFVAVSVLSRVDIAPFLNMAAEHPDVLECHHITGEVDFLLKVRTASTRTLTRFLQDDLRGHRVVDRTVSYFVMSSSKETTRMNVDLEVKERSRKRGANSRQAKK